MGIRDLPSGLIIPSTTPELHPESTFELPVVIQARLAPMNTVHFGAFTGVYGGRVGHCTIGRYCSIAPEVDIAADQHPTDWLSSSMIQYVPDIHGWGSWLGKNGYDYTHPSKGFNSNAPVTIGNDVWIGQGVFIKSGVSIGDGAVVASHAVVVSDVPPFAMVAGVPARIKKYRFSDALIDRISRLAWWNYNIMAVPGVDFSDVGNALDEIERLVDSGRLEPYSSRRVRFSELME